MTTGTIPAQAFASLPLLADVTQRGSASASAASCSRSRPRLQCHSRNSIDQLLAACGHYGCPRRRLSRVQAALLGVGSADGTGDNLVAMLTRAEMSTIAGALDARLLTETEWEYVHRGGRHSLFCVPDLLRNDETTARYMSWDCADARRPTSGFGLSVLFAPEWTASRWNGDDREAVCRSGGAYFWPWQDEEWCGV